MNKMASNFNNRLLEALETISGLRGNPELHAVRKRDLEPVRKKIYATSVLATETLKATEENTYQLTDESDGTILSRIIEAKARAEEVAEEAALVDEKAQAVRDDHDALVDGFVGKLSDAFDGVDADIDAVGVDVSSIVKQVTGLLPSGFNGGAQFWQEVSGTLAPQATNTPYPIAYDAALSANAIELSATNKNVATKGVVEVQSDRVYEIEVKGRVTNDGTKGPIFHYLGISTWDSSGVALATNFQFKLPEVSVADGVFHLTMLVAGANSVAYPAGSAGLNMNAAAAAFRPQYRVNGGNNSDATAKISMLAVREVTGISKADSVKATLETQYLTSEGVDGAIAALRTLLQAGIDDNADDIGQVSATLTSEYLTKADTESAIALVQTELAARIDENEDGIGSITADLAVNYLTKTAIDAAIAAVQTELSARIDGNEDGIGSITADLTANYLTKTAVDAAIAAVQTLLQAQIAENAEDISSVSADLLTNYLTEVAVNEAIAAAKTELGVQLSKLEEGSSVYQRVLDDVDVGQVGDAVTVAKSAPVFGQSGALIVSEDGTTGRNYGSTTNGYRLEIPTLAALQFAARRVKISVLARQPASNAAASFSISYSTAEVGNSGGMSSGALTGGWQWYSFYYDVPAPANGGTDFIGLFGDDSKTGLGTEFAQVRVEVAAESTDLPDILELQGNITSLFALDANGLDGTVMGAMLNELNVAGNGKIAGVDNFGTAMADMLGNTSAVFVLRARSGGGVGELEIASWDDASGSGSAITLSADYIFAKGVLQADKLSVGRGVNLLQNADFRQSFRNWSGPSGPGGSRAETEVLLRPAGLTYSGANFPVMQMKQTGNDQGGYADFLSVAEDVNGVQNFRHIPVKAGDWLMASSYLAVVACSVQIIVVFRKADGTLAGQTVSPMVTANAVGTSANPNDWPRHSLLVQAPANAEYAQLYFRKWPTSSGATSDVYIHAPMIEAAHEAVTVPSAWSSSATTLIDGNSIYTGTVTAEKMDVAELSAISATIGHFKTSETGERTEIKDSGMRCYYENGQISFAAGDISDLI